VAFGIHLSPMAVGVASSTAILDEKASFTNFGSDLSRP